ncbi:MAG: hypothetical protein WBA57_26400 [Elainellaceae cyanobacterium]
MIEAPVSLSVSEGVFVLVELSENEIISIQDASEWILELVQKYLTMGLTPEVLQQEAERVEAWRQELTLQNQDIARRSLEIETRRDQIQELEKKLELERKHLESTKEHDGDRPEAAQESLESVHAVDESSVQATTN